MRQDFYRDVVEFQMCGHLWLPLVLAAFIVFTRHIHRRNCQKLRQTLPQAASCFRECNAQGIQIPVDSTSIFYFQALESLVQCDMLEHRYDSNQ